MPHPDNTQREQICHLCETVGAAEVLRVIAAFVAHTTPSLTDANEFRSRLNDIAKDVGGLVLDDADLA